MLTTITFLKDYRCFKQGEVLKLDTGNSLILVGDQGTGKSSIFNLMNHLNEYKEIAVVDYRGPRQTRFFDTEKMNPRTQNSFGISKVDFAVSLFGTFSSHGQTMLPIMTAKDLLNNPEPMMLIVDEPESGLSLQSQFKLLAYYQEALKRGHYVTIATHSPILMKLNDQVYDVANRKTVSANDYIRSIVGNLLG